MSIGSSAALRALIASRRAMDVIGHNLANQNTPGYSRQLALLATTAPVQGNHLLRFGTGVEVAAVRSSVNEALLARIRTELSSAGRSLAQNDLFDQVETLFADLSENGLATKLQNFFDGATEAATSPEDPVLRQNLLASASDLALSFRMRSNGLKELRTKSLLDAQGVVAEANQLLSQVAALNSTIKAEEAPWRDVERPARPTRAGRGGSRGADRRAVDGDRGRLGHGRGERRGAGGRWFGERDEGLARQSTAT
jgi:flagellar hook-associated protein 1 FlgK